MWCVIVSHIDFYYSCWIFNSKLPVFYSSQLWYYPVKTYSKGLANLVRYIINSLVRYRTICGVAMHMGGFLQQLATPLFTCESYYKGMIIAKASMIRMTELQRGRNQGVPAKYATTEGIC